MNHSQPGVWPWDLPASFPAQPGGSEHSPPHTRSSTGREPCLWGRHKLGKTGQRQYRELLPRALWRSRLIPLTVSFLQGRARAAQVYVGQGVPAPEGDGGGGLTQVVRHLSGYSSCPGLPHLLGEAGRREGVELPLNRTQVPETTPLLNCRVPSTD